MNKNNAASFLSFQSSLPFISCLTGIVLDCAKIPGCSSAQVAPATLIPGVIFSGSLDGYLRAYDVRNGHVIWDFDTARDFKTTDGVKAHGGSLNKNEPVVAGGMLYVQTGNFVGMPGNALLAFSIDGE